uniref:Uncharacterized protein n=1 Tax=Anguilla anguilla TaxID=7936 RepID=A0A0E9QJR5_ANGAN
MLKRPSSILSANPNKRGHRGFYIAGSSICLTAQSCDSGQSLE